MFRRFVWLSVGAGFGFGMSIWLTRFLRDVADRYSPESVAGNLGDAVGKVGRDLREAVREGRAAMREREEELRADIGDTARHRPFSEAG